MFFFDTHFYYLITVCIEYEFLIAAKSPSLVTGNKQAKTFSGSAEKS